MRLKEIRFYNFRNLSDFRVECDSILNLIIGLNGQGKTNLIEGVSLLCSGKSFRTTKTSELVRWGEKQASVFAVVEDKYGEFELGMSIQAGRRKCFFNGDQLSSLAEFLGRLLVVSFSPTDLSLIKGSPGERRRFLDQQMTALRPELLKVLLDYQKAIKNKNALLREESTHTEEIYTWNKVIADTASVILEGRKGFIKKLEEKAAALYRELRVEDGEVALTLNSGLSDCSGPEDIYEKLNSQISRERDQRSSLIGPHRDELLISLGKHEARAYASQGQSRSLVLSLLIGTFDLVKEARGVTPVVLLDDVDSELDSERSRWLFQRIIPANAQVFITGTKVPESLSEGQKQARRITLSNGQIIGPQKAVNS